MATNEVPLPIIPGLFRCSLRWVNGSESAANVIHVSSPSGNPTSVFNSLTTAVASPMWSTVALGARITSVAILPYDGVTATTFFTTTGTQWDATGQTADYDPAVAALVKLATGKRGHAGHGRVYLPFLDSALSTGGVLGSTQVTALTAAWNSFRTAAGSAGIPLQVAHLGTVEPGPPPVRVGAAANPVSSCAAESALGTQRRRQKRVRKSLGTP